MEDEEVALNNACADLVSLKKYEPFPLRLLGSRRPGEWTAVREFCRQIGVAANDLTPGLFAAWLPEPNGHDGYVVILFYDGESQWSMAALYNRARVAAGTSLNPVAVAAEAVLPAASPSSSHSPSPTVERQS